MKEAPASEPEPVYQVKVDGTNVLIKKQGKSKSLHQIELTLIEKDKVDSTDVMSFKFTKHNDYQIDNKTVSYIAGQFAFFDIGEVYNDPKGPIRHFTISSSPTENFIMFSTRIRDSPYKKRLVTLEKGQSQGERSGRTICITSRLYKTCCISFWWHRCYSI